MNTGRYSTPAAANTAPGWTLTTLLTPSPLFGANGMKIGPDGELYVAQAFGSQISALDPNSGSARTVVPVGSPVVAPDDLAFDTQGTMYITEVMSERVSARLPNGELRVIAENVPVANGITTHDDHIFMDEFRTDGRVLELYADGRAPRVIAEHLNHPNALAMGPDGYLYFPLVTSGEIWRVAVTGGVPERVIAGLAFPTAAKFSPRGELHTVEAASGAITRIDLQTRATTTLAKVRPGIDNFAFAPDGRLFVSHFIDGGVAEIDAAGREKVLVAAGLLGPFGLATGADGTLYIADGMSLVTRKPDGTLAARPGLLINHDFPGFARGVAVAADGACYLTTSGGMLARYRPGAETKQLATSLNQATGIALAPDGSVLVCETGAGCVLRIASDGNVTTVARGLAGPIGVVAMPDGSCFVSESVAGRVVHLRGGSVTPVVRGLREPHGLALHGDSLFILDRAAKTLTQFSHTSGKCELIAENLPVGNAPGILPRILPGIADVIPGPLLPFADLATTADGRILIGADGAGAVLALSRG